MVDFNTRVFTEDDGKIIGAEITVYSDSGDKIGLIDVADAETLEEMQTQLAVIDETYFTEARLATILANTNENTVINATKLNGFLSSDFAKVSQLSAYALLSHTHSKSQITDLYDYQIYANNYNVNIGSSVTITVKVTNRATGNPVIGVSVPVLKNNAAWQSGTTGVNGTFSLSYTTDTFGLTTFSAQNASTQIRAKGWKTHLNDSSYTVYYNEDFTNVNVHLNGANVPTSWANWAEILPESLRPHNSLVFVDMWNSVLLRCNSDSSNISVKTVGNSALSNHNIYASTTFKRKG